MQQAGNLSQMLRVVARGMDQSYTMQNMDPDDLEVFAQSFDTIADLMEELAHIGSTRPPKPRPPRLEELIDNLLEKLNSLAIKDPENTMELIYLQADSFKQIGHIANRPSSNPGRHIGSKRPPR
jgi:hypothetical protein